MVQFLLSEKGKKSFDKLPYDIQPRIREKLSSLQEHPDVFKILAPVYDILPATHRLRIGHYRLLLELKKNTKDTTEFLILKAGHRKDIYR
jgi:mRNA-degrading endonuclease RelE of RelBE toxin-antitoxin system